MSYTSPAIARMNERRAREAAEADRLGRARDWTDLTFEQFQALSGAERNELLIADPDKYRTMRDH